MIKLLIGTLTSVLMKFAILEAFGPACTFIICQPELPKSLRE